MLYILHVGVGGGGWLTADGWRYGKWPRMVESLIEIDKLGRMRREHLSRWPDSRWL
jgi:hypothetical protein